MSGATAKKNATQLLEERARERAAQAFKDHKIWKEGEGRYYCGKPHDGNYHFRVILAPRAVFMYGDLYELTLLISDKDPLPWLRSVLRDGREIGYPLSKVPASMKDSLRGFCEDLAREIIEQHEREEPEKAEQWAELREATLGHGDDREAGREWDRMWYEKIVQDCEWPSATTWTPMALLQLEALRWFSQHVDEKGEPLPEVKPEVKAS